jgi:hypothetical protein
MTLYISKTNKMKTGNITKGVIKLHFSIPVRLTFLVLVTLFLTVTVYSQDTNSVQLERKNSVKVNITNPMIFGKNAFVFGYERTIGNHQSFSVNMGKFSMPKLFSIGTDSIIDNSSNRSSKGISLSGDYRFYLANENKYNSPHGIYIGPYFAFNKFSRQFELTVNSNAFKGQINTDFSFRAATMGFQLGYQFIFWNRVSLDMILFGPGISFYKLNAGLSTTFDPNQEAALFKKINDVLQEKIPGYSLAVKPGSFEKTGSGNTTGAGYRYVVMIGFRF